MSSWVYAEPGTSQTKDTVPLGTVTGSVTSSTAAAHTSFGPNGILLTLTGTGPHNCLIPIDTTTPGRIQFFIRQTTAGSGTSDNRSLCTSIPGTIAYNRNTNLITLNSSTSGSGLTPTLNQWYRFCMCRKPNGSNWDIRWYVDGVQQMEALNVAGTPTSSIQFGHSAAVATHGVWNIVGLLIDDDQTNTDMGDLRCCYKAPNGTTGTTNAFDTTFGSGANRQAYINERPSSLTNNLQDTTGNTPGALETFNIQSASTGDVDISGKVIVGRGSWIYGKCSAGTHATEAKIVIDGTEIAKTLTTTNAYYAVFDSTSTYPGDNACGLRAIDGTADTILYECGSIIIYDVAPKLNLSTGSYSHTGAAAGLQPDYPLNLGTGSYAVSGVVASFYYDHPLSAGTGSYSHSGVSISALVAHVVDAVMGSYSITGQDSGLPHDYPGDDSPGVYAITGFAADLSPSRFVAAGVGSYGVSGVAAVLEGRVLNAGKGGYTITGAALVALVARQLNLAVGSYTHSGLAAAIGRLLDIGADGGLYFLNGYPVANHPYILNAVAGTYGITGADAELAGHDLHVAIGEYLIVSPDAQLTYVRAIGTGVGSYGITGKDTTLFVQRNVKAPYYYYANR